MSQLAPFEGSVNEKSFKIFMLNFSKFNANKFHIAPKCIIGKRCQKGDGTKMHKCLVG